MIIAYEMQHPVQGELSELTDLVVTEFLSLAPSSVE
jgi:hypothetical protein